jgi:DNA-binding transcriptional LysR family regulator
MNKRNERKKIMDLLQLKYFQKVARLEHMTQAANQLSIA